MTPELSRLIDVRHLPERVRVEATAQERAALARRFALDAIERVEADIALTPQGAAIVAEGRVEADVVQTCAVSGEPFPNRIAEAMTLRFVQGAAVHAPGEELEIDAEDCDEIAFDGTQFDLGEAVAQTLSLGIDPYACGPDAEAAREAAGLGSPAADGPFAALAKLRK